MEVYNTWPVILTIKVLLLKILRFFFTTEVYHLFQINQAFKQ